METFKENTYYPIGTKLIYKDKIIEVRTRRHCGDCVFKSEYCGDMQIRCSDGNTTYVQFVVIGDAPAQHDAPGVKLKPIMPHKEDVYTLGNIATRNNVFITVEPVKKIDIHVRISEKIKNWHDTRRTCKYGTDAILLPPKEWEEFIAYLEMKDCCNPPGRRNIIDKTVGQIYLNHVVFMSPQVKDVEVL
jgi:hypothetical protein